MVDICMYGIGKIDYCCFVWYGYDFVFGCKDIDFVGKEVDFDVFEEFG